jgi:hypothetical protein
VLVGENIARAGQRNLVEGAEPSSSELSFKEMPEKDAEEQEVPGSVTNASLSVFRRADPSRIYHALPLFYQTGCNRW